METDCVYCEVQTEILYRMVLKYVLQDAKRIRKEFRDLKKKKLNAKCLMEKATSSKWQTRIFFLQPMQIFY